MLEIKCHAHIKKGKIIVFCTLMLTSLVRGLETPKKEVFIYSNELDSKVAVNIFQVSTQIS
jgi:hypothetical protein